jgi:hypothetical protein
VQNLQVGNPIGKKIKKNFSLHEHFLGGVVRLLFQIANVFCLFIVFAGAPREHLFFCPEFFSGFDFILPRTWFCAKHKPGGQYKIESA